jgi:hypothetical protein
LNGHFVDPLLSPDLLGLILPNLKEKTKSLFDEFMPKADSMGKNFDLDSLHGLKYSYAGYLQQLRF